MFKILKDDKIIGISETTPELLDNYEVIEVDEDINSYVQVDGEYLLNTNDKVILFLQEQVRQVRNNLLVEYVDVIVSNPLRWNDMPIADQNEIKDYRRYLLDFTTNENWWLENPKTFVAWKN